MPLLDVLFNGDMLWFSLPAVIGTLFFSLRTVLMLFGHHGGGLDFHHDVGHLHPDSDGQFQWLSLQSAAAFLMGFGWGGIGAFKGSNLSLGLSMLIGLGCGALLLVLFVFLMHNLRKLAASGNVPIETLAGAEGDVAATVPARGTGRGEVRLVIGTRERRCWAVSAAEAISSRARVRVVAVNPDNTVTVQAI